MTKRIAVISEHASPLAVPGGVDSGGQNVYVGHLARHLGALGYAVDVFTRRDSTAQPETSVWTRGVRIVHVPAGPPSWVRKEKLLPFMAPFTRWVLDFCRRTGTGYDLSHANFWMSGLVAAEVKRALGTPFVVTFHALGRVRRAHQRGADRFPDVRFRIEDRIVAEADRIIAECPQDEADLRALYDADPAAITMVPCGFDPAEFFPVEKRLARRVIGLHGEGPVILQLGRMVPRKGVDNVIRGFARLRRRHHVPARLVIVGGDADTPDPRATPEIGRLMAVARDEGVDPQVLFTGRRDRAVLRYYYGAADVFVTTPWYEPFGMTPVEAMACGTPVVGAAVGGIPYSVVDGETGYLVPPFDPDALAERMARLCRTPGLRAAFGCRGIRRVHERFTWRQVAVAIAALYEEVLASPEPARRPRPPRVLLAEGQRRQALADGGGPAEPAARPVGAHP